MKSKKKEKEKEFLSKKLNEGGQKGRKSKSNNHLRQTNDGAKKCREKLLLLLINSSLTCCHNAPNMKNAYK